MLRSLWDWCHDQDWAHVPLPVLMTSCNTDWYTEKRTLYQHIRFHLNLITSTKDLVIYCLRKACSAWMRNVQLIALVTEEHTNCWTVCTGNCLAWAVYLLSLRFWFTLCFEIVRILINTGPMHCYVEVIRNWDAPVQCVMRPRTVTWVSLNFTVCVCVYVCNPQM